MSLASALANDLVAALQQKDGAPRSVLLWLDPDGGFTRLRDAVAVELNQKGATLLGLDAGGSQFELKLQLLETEASAAFAIVHLPNRTAADLQAPSDGRPPALWGLVEYLFKGAVWGRVAGADEIDPPALDRWLEQHGVRFSGGSARAAVIAGGADSKLARFAARKAYLDPAEFPRPLNSAAISPAGDPRDRMIELLLDPIQAVVDWGDSRRDVQELAADIYAISWAGDDPAKWASQFAFHIAVVEAWDATGRAPDFPFAERIPASDRARTAVVDFVRQGMMPRPDVAGRVRFLVAQQAADLGSLTEWASSRAGWPVAVPSIIDRRVAAILSAVENAQPAGVGSAMAALAASMPSGVPWGRIDARLEAMANVLVLARAVQKAQPLLVKATEAGPMAAEFSHEGWKVDAAWLSIAEQCREIAELAPIRRLAARVYAEYVDKVNQRFTDLVETSGSWPPVGLPAITVDSAAIWSHPTKAKGRRAVLVVDALRMDVARALQERLGASAEIQVRASTLPTTTPFGMTALLPGADHAKAVFASGGPELSIDGHKSLESKDGRKEYVAFVLAEQGDSVAYVELESVLQGGSVPDTRFVVLFTYALDDQGHSMADTASLPEEAGRLPGRLARVIERLHASGIGQIDVMTDHGFLWLDPDDVDALQHPSVPAAQVRTKTQRYIVLQAGAMTSDVVRLPVPFNPEEELGFPRGARTFTKASWYLHGGLSLQESVIPHLISRAAPPPRRVGVAFEIPSPELAGATVAVRARPVVDEQEGEQLELAVPRPLRIRIEVVTTDAVPRRVSDAATLELRHDSPELATAVYLTDGVRLKVGSRLQLTAHDVETGEELLRKDLHLLTDWD